jgi:type II secretory pathway component PulC
LRMQSLLKQITLLNCILVAGILALGYFVLLPAFTKEVKVVVKAATPLAAEQKKSAAVEPPNPPLQDYAVVAEKNLFHPERIIPVIKVVVEVPRPEFVLYGTLIANNVSIAYISDSKVPRTTPGRGQRQTGLKIGETMSGYTLKEVLPDRVVMVHGDDRIEVNVTASKKKRSSSETAAPAFAPPGTAPGSTATAPGAVAPPLPVIQRSVAAPPVARRGRY